MKEQFFRISAIVLVGALALVFVCGGQQVQPTQAPFSAPRFDAADYDPKVNNFLVLFDGSSSMSSKYQGSEKLEMAKNVAQAMNQSIPELGYTAYLRSFGPDDGTGKDTILIFGPDPYSTQEFGGAIAELRGPAGNTPVGRAFDASLQDMEGVMGGESTALILISDGKDPLIPANPEAAVRNFKLANPNACIYTVLVGDDPAGQALMQKIAEVGECGFATTADEIYSTAGMAEFVQAVFLTEKPEPVAVAPPPCPDADNDGVCDDDDRCPGTPLGATVDQFGCWAFSNYVLFDFDKYVVKPEAYPMLDEAAKILRKNPDLKVVLEGHTDWIGTEEYNQKLSERRANAVEKHFIKRGVPDDQMETVGFGELKPRATNETEEGRALNRRVEITPAN